MTAAKNTTRASSGDATIPAPRDPKEVERLQDRIDELERAAKEQPSARAIEMQRVALGVLGGAVVVTAPLAFVTVKRWWRWWTI